LFSVPRTVVQYQLARLAPVARSRLESGGNQRIAVVKASGPSHIEVAGASNSSSFTKTSMVLPVTFCRIAGLSNHCHI
jgi:hypothetical protein